MIKALVFDMDGTIADLYSIPDWLPKLLSENPSPYEEAPPKVDFEELYNLLDDFVSLGVEIIINTWLCKGSTAEYDKKVRRAKLQWLKYHNFPYDEVHITKYGRCKADATRKKEGEQILIDDNEKVRKGWNLGRTIDANGDIIKELLKILLEMKG